MRRTKTGLALAALLLALQPRATLAASDPAAGDAAAARPIVAEHCATCHQVPGLEARFAKARVTAPAFQAIADDPAKYPEAQLRAFLQKPHFPMGSLILSPSDIDNIVAFIASLRGKAE
ncbi:Cytochrome c553 [Tistlia consotensis]|uniref:Cytochrome c553 n=1 Tax=Tistlia consotensis USBA 355 TaxID=560819 RepID=A0A1Y6CBU3_9PROT|nr:cytochrome c [Tistlia consotensis]SMF55875.1 Cytochrome c553 [Tistlia consotensis USBA 355]SNR89471.1 Cytochrome c553 [Tistlia consotensis]